MNTISSNYEVITFYVICLLIWMVVTGRVESVIRSIGGNVDITTNNEPTAGEPAPTFGPPTSSGPPKRSR